MNKPYCYEYPRPSVTVDLVVFTLAPEGIRTLFIRRKKDPFAGKWAIPGGFLEMDEAVDFAALRELREETGLVDPQVVEPIGWFGDPRRDPRGRTISLAHAAVIRWPPPSVKGGDDAAEAAWLDPDSMKDLAFDHDRILKTARQWLSTGVSEGRLVAPLLPETFALEDVRRLFRQATGSTRGSAAWKRWDWKR